MKAASFLFGLAALFSADRALGYCRTSHCPATDKDGHVCTPAAADDCGFAVYWSKPRVTYSVQANASNQVSLEQIRATLRKAFETWLTADCGDGKHPRFEVVETDPVECNRHEYNQKLGNANIVLFQDVTWPYGENDGRLALTTVSYSPETGEIYDADMEINSAHANFTTGDTSVQTDLLAVVTHEAGHFLGLAHSLDAQATMFPTYDAGTTTQRDLDTDDIEGICATHPPGEIASACDPTARHGFSPLCGMAQATPPAEPEPVEDCCCVDGQTCEKGVCIEAEGCCTIAPGSGGRRSDAALGVTVLGLCLLAARRRARRM